MSGLVTLRYNPILQIFSASANGLAPMALVCTRHTNLHRNCAMRRLGLMLTYGSSQTCEAHHVPTRGLILIAISTPLLHVLEVEVENPGCELVDAGFGLLFFVIVVLVAVVVHVGVFLFEELTQLLDGVA